MTLGIVYNLYDGIELLPFNIKQLRNEVDYILINCQLISYFGKLLNKENLDIIYQLEKDKLVDQINFYKPNKIVASSIYEAKELEKEKRNIGKRILLEKKLNYFLDLDVDEFYISEEFKNAKNFIFENKIDLTAVQFKNYHNLPILRERNFSNSIIHFISKLDNKILQGSSIFGNCDPTRGLTPEIGETTYMFPNEKIFCHHLTTCRKDLFLKYNNTTLSKLNRNSLNELIITIKNLKENNLTIYNDFPNLKAQELEIVDNLFNIPIELFQ